MLRNYWDVIKPGIVFGNLVSLMGGFFLAARGHVDVNLLFATVIGTGLVIAAACVLNNCLDKNTDRLMARTRERVLVTGRMTTTVATGYAVALCAAGTALLLSADNLLTVALVLGGFVIYVGIYSPLKHCSAIAPLIGGLAGAAPPLAGYCSVTGQFDTGAAILLLIFVLWQMPHFYAIAIYRLDDYVAAATPVLPAKQGIPATRRHILVYIAAFIAAAVWLHLSGYTGYVCLATMVALGVCWFALAWKGYQRVDVRRWSRTMFICSVVSICAFSVTISIDFSSPPAQAASALHLRGMSAQFP
jgi:protoheme IX farnesyltransferase